MKIIIKYDNDNVSKAPIETVVEISDEQGYVMIETDYQNRLAAAEDKTLVKRREIQQIFDEEFNKPHYNDWHREKRHKGFVNKPFLKDDEDYDTSDGLDYIPDYTDEENRERQYEYEAVCQRLRKILKPAYAEVLIDIVLNGLTPEEYAAKKGEKTDAVYKRLMRAKEKYKKFL